MNKILLGRHITPEKKTKTRNIFDDIGVSRVSGILSS